MKELSDYNESVSDHEFFSFLYDRIISREINVFSQLKEFAGPVLRDRRTHPVIMRAFELIKKLNWGFFSTITPTTHGKLWAELVISDTQFPEAGDMKRTLSISNLYVCMLDIHGYTQFCQEFRKNLSMLHTLDRAINGDIRQISTKCHAVSQRERGDEIVVVTASATDAITATLAIFDYFSKTNVLNDPEIPTKRNGDTAILPVLKLTGGITGGNTSVPLIITEQGNLAGFLLNSGARLQTRANELSPKEAKVMVTKQVQMNYDKENARIKCTLEKNKTIYFFDAGIIEFKGVLLPSCEIVFKENERFKENYAAEIARLFNSIRDSLWEQAIFADLTALVSKSVEAMPPFSVTLAEPIRSIATVTNKVAVQFCKAALKAYSEDEDYSFALGLLKDLIIILAQIPEYDRLILDYLRGITAKYEFLLGIYLAALDDEVDEKAARVFTGDYLKTWNAVKSSSAIYEKLRLMGRRSAELNKKKNLWYNLIKQNKDAMEFTLYSGKK
ncbi:hypothetical protein AGMMS49928_19980 [Spirochaetia bacterium]|nr:hypothetical protein AGMMS49928_19980 [Spirochaetia bacterium]